MQEIKANRLINTTSPYLLQHAYNPVDWYPWGDEAFEKAKNEDKPIFLSIGYSTCHWCHVMERECFEDKEVARLLNYNFISIKVDREERPDIDNIYMTACQMLTGQGGWPLSIFMTWDKKPFFAGTYFPKHRKYGTHGFMDLLGYISELWKDNREKLLDVQGDIEKNLKNFFHSDFNGDMINEEDIKKAYQTLEYSFDWEYGGFGYQPKFPTPQNLLFLMRYYKVTGTEQALEMVEKTLINMFKGGIFDHIGYGFSRYSTDNRWLVPHFEKMLYDNALLLRAYVEAYQITDKDVYKDIAEKIIAYEVKEMRDFNGVFYSAQDADSEGVEGKFYLWTKDEIIDILGKDRGEKFCKVYDITEEGNFENKNILNLIDTKISALNKKINKMREEIYEKRNERIHPFLDDKIIVSWNGYMIASLAYAGRIFDNEEYIRYAKEALKFIKENMFVNGKLCSTYRKGQVLENSFSLDYASIIWSLIEIYQATFNKEYLDLALKLYYDVNKYFLDKDNGGYYQFETVDKELGIRPKEIHDGASPSANSIMANNLINLYKLTGDTNILDMADKQLSAFSRLIKSNPTSSTYFLCAAMNKINDGGQVVIVEGENKDIDGFLDVINDNYLPFTTVVVDKEEEKYKKVEDKTTVYVCKDFSCKEPVNSVRDFKKLLN